MQAREVAQEGLEVKAGRMLWVFKVAIRVGLGWVLVNKQIF